ncbi:hypothetical protein SNEBB_002657 [Seison nebaliae]|nr:hypothetical protein SNEBB_002657 [Seison nebaliae]
MVNCLFYEKPDYFPIPLAPWDERYEFLFNSSMGRQTTVKVERDLYQLISQLIFFNPVYRIKCFDDIRKSNFFQNVSWDDYLKGDYLKNCPNDFLEIISRLKLNLHRSNSYYDLNIHNKYISRQIGHRLLMDGKGRYVFPDNAFSAFRNEMRIKCDQPPSNFDSYQWISFMGSDTIANYPISLRYECSELENMLCSIERNSFIS